MSKVTHLYDIFSVITKPEFNSPDYYFYRINHSEMKSSKDNVVIVGAGFSNSNLFESNEKEYDHDFERNRYLLNNVYKFDFETYELVEDVMNVKVSDFSMCRAIDQKSNKKVYFKNALKVNVFGRDIKMGNGLLQKYTDVTTYKMGSFKPGIQMAGFTNHMPSYPEMYAYADGIEKDFAFYYPGAQETVVRQLRNLKKWIKAKDFVTDAEYTYLEKYKKYLDDLANHWKIYENADWKRKNQAMALMHGLEK